VPEVVAVARALLARPGLLVLDEAWTGLDQAARGTLDAAVTERLAEGLTVVFVDHDAARLASRVDERWRLTSGIVTVTGGSGHAGESIASAAGNAVVVIELAGLETESLAQVSQLSGVLAAVLARVPSRADGAPAAARITVLAVASDAVLRHLLSWEGLHVRAVHAEPELRPAEPESPLTVPEEDQ
jgi:ABC-2 type transport system ATP-binding protein